MKKLLLYFFFFVLSLDVIAQQSSTKGTEFWATFLQNYSGTLTSASSVMKLTVHFSAQQSAVVTITNPNTSYTKTLTVPANTLISDTVTIAQSYNMGSGNIVKRGLKITSTSEVTMYAMNYQAATSDATVILPTSALGTRYRIMSYKGFSTLPSEFGILATQDSTIINITTTCNTSDNKIKNVTYTIMLQKGETYQAQSKTDSSLAGTLIEVQNCKPIAVFGGVQCTNVPTGCSSCDHLYEQLFPLNMWGKEFILIPTASRTKDRYIILADKATTVVTINGTPTTITNAGGEYEADLTTPLYVSANKPVSAMIYAVGQSCGGSTGDPMMMWVTPAEQNINSIIFLAISSPVITAHYVNIVAKTSTVGSIKLNGSSISSLFSTVSSNPNYSYVKKSITAGTNTITSDSGFTAYAYGYGSAESYGYNVGSSTRDLNRYFTINSVNNDNFSTPVKSMKVCRNTPIYFNGVSGTYTPLFWLWKFNNDTASTQSVTKTFTDTGLVKVMMITSWVGSNMCSANDTTLDTAIQYIRVIDPMINIKNPDTAFCRGGSVQIRISLSGDSTIVWKPSADVSCATCPEPLITPVSSQWYKATIGGGSLGCKVTDSIFIRVRDSVHLSLGTDTMICKGQPARIRTTILNPDTTDSYIYKLYENNVLIKQDTIGNFLVYPDTTKTYFIKVSSSCFNANSNQVKVYIRPPLKIIYNDSFLICRNRNSSFSFKVSGGDSSYNVYLAKNNLIVDSILNAVINVNYSFLFTPDPAASYKIILKDGCTIISDTPTVHFKYRLPLSLSHTPDTLVCRDQQIHLNFKGSGGDSTYTFYLLKNNIAIDSMLNATPGTAYFFQVSTPVNMLYKIVMKDGCTDINDTESIFVSVRTPLSFTVSNDSNICEGMLTSIYVRPAGGDSTYSFYLLDSTARVDSILNAVAGQTYHFDVHPTFKTKFRIVLTDGCTKINDTVNVYYTFRTPLNFQHSGDTTICKGRSVVLNVKPFGGDSTYSIYLIKNNSIVDSIVGATLAVSHSFTVAPLVSTVYTIVLSDGCTYLNDTEQIKVNVRNPLSLNVVNQSLICRGQWLNMIATPSGGDSTYRIYLYNNNLLIDSVLNAIPNNSYTFNQQPALNASYKFVLRDECTIINDTQKVDFNFRNALNFITSGDATICLGRNYPILVTPAGGDSTYSFYLLQGNTIIDSITNASYGSVYFFTVAPVLNSVYKIVLKDGCTLINDTQTIHVYVRNPLSFTYTNTAFICEGLLSFIRVNASGGDSSYTFYLLDSTLVIDSIKNAVPGQWYSFGVHPTFLTHFKVRLTDNCTVKSDTQNVYYTFRPPIGFTRTQDTMLCTGQSMYLKVNPFGGDSSYNIYLIKNNVVIDSILNASMLQNYYFKITPTATTTYTLVLSDECTYLNDTQAVRVTLRAPLSMNIVHDSVICRGQPLLIKVTTLGGDSTYALYMYNNNVLIDSVKNAICNTTYSFNELPALNARYHFILKDGCTILRDSQMVSFVFRGPLSFNHTPNPTICIGQSATLTVTPFGGDSTYSIYLLQGGNTIDSIKNATLGNNFNFTVSPVIGTDYAVKITDGCTITTDSQAIRVNVRNALNIVVPRDTIICKGQSVGLPVIASGGDSTYTIYLLKNGIKIDSFTNAKDNYPYTFIVSPGVKTVYEIRLQDGCTKLNASGFVTVDVYPPLLVKATISLPKICYGEWITLTAAASGGAFNSVIRYNWNHNAGNKTLIKLKPTVSAWYVVSADDGCSTMPFDSVYIEVEPNPIAAFTAANTAGCEPFTVQFSNTSTTFSNVSYLWKFGDGTSDTATTPAPHTYVKPGSYEVKLTIVSAFGCKDSVVKKSFITVYSNPEIELVIDPKKVKVNNGKINFKAGFFYTDYFDFDFGDNKTILNQPASGNIFAHIYTDTGYFRVKLTARNNFGCSTELTDSLFIEDYYTVFIPNVFSPNNNDGKNDYFKPVSTFSKSFDMAIYDRWGQLVYRENCSDRWFNCKGWDGTYEGQPAPIDTYIYIITLYEENAGKWHTEKGTVMLLR